MKKIIVLGLVLAMVMGLAAMASASETDWVVLLRAGNLSGTSWVGSAAMNTYGVTTSALSGSYADAGAATWVSTTIGFYTTDTSYVYGTRKYQSCDTEKKVYTWNLKLKAGDSWSPTTTFNLYYASPVALPGGDWKLTLSNGETTYVLPNPPTNGGTTASFYTFATGLTMNPGESAWTLTMEESVVPEPGSMLAMLSGLVGLAGFGIRRRK